MRKKIKIILVIAIASLCLFTQDVRGTFGVEVGDKAYYKVSTASTEITVDELSETFTGFKFAGVIQEENTIYEVLVKSISPTLLVWNATLGNLTIAGNIEDELYEPVFGTFFAIGGIIFNGIDITSIINTGIINPLYFYSYFLPYFISTVPATWSIMYSFCLDQGTDLLLSLGPGVTACDYTWHNEGIASLEYWWNYTSVEGPGTEFDVYCSTFYSYNKTTGKLLKSSVDIDITGTEDYTTYSIFFNYELVETEVPGSTSLFDQYKWYIIGGGGGVVVIAATGTIIGVSAKKRKAKTTSKGKKKTTKKGKKKK